MLAQHIAHFIPNFDHSETRVSWGKKFDWQHSLVHPRKSPDRHKNLADIFYTKPSYSQLCPKFHCHGNQGGSGVKLNNTIKLAIPENHTIEPKIMTILYTA